MSTTLPARATSPEGVSLELEAWSLHIDAPTEWQATYHGAVNPACQATIACLNHLFSLEMEADTTHIWTGRATLVGYSGQLVGSEEDTPQITFSFRGHGQLAYQQQATSEKGGRDVWQHSQA